MGNSLDSKCEKLHDLRKVNMLRLNPPKRVIIVFIIVLLSGLVPVHGQAIITQLEELRQLRGIGRQGGQRVAGHHRAARLDGGAQICQDRLEDRRAIHGLKDLAVAEARVGE